jgi:hypothetical protein
MTYISLVVEVISHLTEADFTYGMWISIPASQYAPYQDSLTD